MSKSTFFMKYLVKMTFFILLVSACKPKMETVEIKTEAGLLKEKFTQDPTSKKKEGVFESFYEDGKIFETATYKQGVLHGERKIYDENGRIQTVEHYENGQFQGPFQAYYSNGQLDLEGIYKDGNMTGEWKRYYDSGELKEIVTFVANQENGPFTEYHKNGKLKTKGAYLNGDNEHGLLEMFDETGTLIQKMNCLEGVCRTEWKKED